MKIILIGLIALLFSIGMIAPSFAHTTVEVDKYHIEVGWGLEPPVVGIRNDIVFKITEAGDTEGSFKGITSAFKNLEATVVFGGVTKTIDVNGDPRPGYYFSPIIPTKTGTYLMDLKGEIAGMPVDVEIPIEDVESTSILNFPPQSSGGSGDVAALKNAISAIQKDVSNLKSGETTVTSDGGVAYDFAIFGLSIAAAAIILAIIALIKRK
ncbi:MAG: hypothetical protein HKM23_01620 [Nitrosopumilus sp.]|nr:hypothetical protein [Nitrosopumilus sp.]NNL58421.1 hypothetical protein [Nitrosopumilus sp.]